jgi:coproporphyrinogen III oxidase-like Fe-S oxidoreductase
MGDFMMVGLRLQEGVTQLNFGRQFEGAVLEDTFGPTLQKLLKLGLLEKFGEPSGYRLTPQGILFGNEVFGAFV